MNPSYAVALIALAGVLLTVGAQLFIGSRQRRSESLDRLFEKKLALYSEMHTFMTAFIRIEQDVHKAKEEGALVGARITAQQAQYAQVQGEKARYKEELQNLRSSLDKVDDLRELEVLRYRLDDLAGKRGQAEASISELAACLNSSRDELGATMNVLEQAKARLSSVRDSIESVEGTLELVAGRQVRKQIKVIGERLLDWDGSDPVPNIQPLFDACRAELGVASPWLR